MPHGHSSSFPLTACVELIVLARVKPVNSAQLISADNPTERSGVIRDCVPVRGPDRADAFTQTFAYFIRSDGGLSRSIELPGVPFILASLMLLSAAVIAWRTTRAEG